jgi:hypothetical protein
MNRLRSKLSYANIVATLALFLVIAGGSAFAAGKLAKNSVGNKQIKNNAITTAKIKNGSVTGAKIAKGSVTGSNINLSSLGAVPSATHATSADTASTATNAGQLGGVPASRYLTLASTLQSGQTETGVWGGSADNTQFAVVPIEFDPRLPGKVEASHQIFIPENGSNPHCPGFGKAETDYLCVYASFENNLGFDQFLSGFSGSSSTPAEPDGTILYLAATSGSANARGNWAYTAP